MNKRADAQTFVGTGLTNSARVEQLDLLRGLVVALMVLDHVRDYFHVSAQLFDAANPAKSWPALFVTRWVTHLCAPTFVFLAGSSIWLRSQSPANSGTIDRYLFGRGIWLIALELTVISFAFNFSAPFLFFQVMFAIGAGMILMAALRHLGKPAIALLGLAILICEPLTIGIGAGSTGINAGLSALLFRPAVLAPAPIFIAYPVLPWFAVMCLGYAAGGLWAMDPARRQQVLGIGGMGLLMFFAALRWHDGFGDFRPWRQNDASTLVSAMAFMNLSKYPPSLDFVAATLGCSALLAASLDRFPCWLLTLFTAFGRTPLFTYLVHIFLIHGLALAAGTLAGFQPAIFTHFLERPQVLAAAHWGIPLWAVYAVWGLVLAALYPVSLRYAAYKARTRAWWTSYL